MTWYSIILLIIGILLVFSSLFAFVLFIVNRTSTIFTVGKVVSNTQIDVDSTLFEVWENRIKVNYNNEDVIAKLTITEKLDVGKDIEIRYNPKKKTATLNNDSVIKYIPLFITGIIMIAICLFI